MSSLYSNIQNKLDALIGTIQSLEANKHEDEKSENITVQTNIGGGCIVNDADKYYTIDMGNMIASVPKSKCIINKASDDQKEMTRLRDIDKNDLDRVYELEVEGYPADEAASKEKLYYRFIFAKEYFKVFTLNGQVIGFICGTKTKESKLTDETMSIHDEDGSHLCIHSVVIDQKQRRKGHGQAMMKSYVKQQRKDPSLSSMRLVCKKHLISFYGDAGFNLIGKSDLEHGADQWYEMSIDDIQ